jgi:hypothetical protein
VKSAVREEDHVLGKVDVPGTSVEAISALDEYDGLSARLSIAVMPVEKHPYSNENSLFVGAGIVHFCTAFRATGPPISLQ